MEKKPDILDQPTRCSTTICSRSITKGEKMEKEKKYRIDQLAICNWEQTHIFPKQHAYRIGDLRFCSKRCKDGYKRDIAWSRM